MPSIRVGSLRLTVYPNDHAPPHAHVIGPGWEIRVEINSPPSLLSIKGAPKTADIAAALWAVHQHRAELEAIWRELHG